MSRALPAIEAFLGAFHSEREARESEREGEGDGRASEGDDEWSKRLLMNAMQMEHVLSLVKESV